jgi:hypothetical protein
MLSHDYLSLCHEGRSRSDVNDEDDDARNDGTSDGGSLNVLIIKYQNRLHKENISKETKTYF